MSIRCLLFAAFAVGFWGVGTAFAQDDPAEVPAAESSAHAEAQPSVDANVAESDEPADATTLFAQRFVVNVQLADTPQDAQVAASESREGAPSPSAQDSSAQSTSATERGPAGRPPYESSITPAEIAESCARACKTCRPLTLDCCPKDCGQCEVCQPECPCDEWDFKCQPSKPDPGEWRVRGELYGGFGSSTDADSDRFGFSLRQDMEDCDGNRFEFYQRYDIDRSYTESNTLTIGARQTFKKWKQNGDLRLQEEFKRYDDQNFDSNDRQEGLFDLKWDPTWDCERWRAEIAYRYNIKEYETFSPLSYKMHRGRVRINNKVNASFDWGAHAEVTSYNYSFGSDRDNMRTEVGLEAGWKQCDADFSASLEHEEKDFDLRKELGYTEDRLDFGVNWKLDCDSRLNARFRATDHERPFEPDRSYEEWLADLTYLRQLDCEWAMKLRGTTRSKQFGDPTDDMDQRMGEVELTYQPNAEWTWHGSAQRDVYDYADVLRAFTRDRWRIGADYYRCEWNFGAEYERQITSYDNDPDRDWQRDTIALNIGYHFGRHDLRVSGEFAVLDQSDPASVNDYDESQLSASWKYRIDCTTDLILSYEDRERRYNLQPAVRDQTLEARLRFEL